MSNAVPVTKALVPDRGEYLRHLDTILASHSLTNNGPLCRKLEQELAVYLHTPRLALCSNGTSALQLALHAAGLAGKRVMTAPFSYVATVSALLWVGCDVVFADIDEETLCLDPASVTERMTPDTAGLLPVHMYGNICDVDALADIAGESGVKPLVIYDAAQCFGSVFRGKSVLEYGDYAVCSFHATKVFHTVEGGCVIAHTPEALEALTLLRACGHRGDEHILLGINAKLSEVHAAVGLSLLDRVADNIAGRAKVSAMYDALLPAQGLRRPNQREGLEYNYAYYPVMFEDEKTLLRVVERLNAKNIFPRRYFYPALNTLPYLKARQTCPVAESIAPRILCLPLYSGLEDALIEKIVRVIAQTL
ncbi:MAG: DegT/DnrJ/EryC1/StrS family aminotransferase [Desulfovibrio sp.]|jgi:dTDP-4-amino-4,6-dideoxygalactose transaminase|nr:DegT/DnrJ/EryC1/StrS family aminotransferase [Desulfovibrio sp.]